MKHWGKVFVCLCIFFAASCAKIESESNIISVPPFGIRVIFCNDPADPDICIQDSAGIISSDDQIEILNYIMAHPLYCAVSRTRTLMSYLNEWRAHNWLFEHGIEMERTISVDLQENEKKARLYIYFILSVMYGYK